MHEISAVFLAVIDMTLFLDENVRLKLIISFKLVHQSCFKTMLKILRMKLYWWNCIVKSSTFISQKKSSIAVIIQKRCIKGIFSLFLRFYSFFWLSFEIVLSKQKFGGSWGETSCPLSRIGFICFKVLVPTTQFPEVPNSTWLIDFKGMKAWFDMGATQWFWTPIPWISNPVP